MAQVLAIAARVLAVVLDILGIAQLIRNLLDSTRVGSIAWQVDSLWRWMSGGAVTYASFYDGLHSEIAPVLTAISNLSTKIDTYTHNDGPQVAVNLPITPPAGYGGGSANDIAAAVWAYQLLNTSGNPVTADAMMTFAGYYARNIGNIQMVQMPRNPHFAVTTLWYDGGPLMDNYDLVDADYSDIRATDTVLTWLQRTSPFYTWSYNALTGHVQALMGATGAFHLYTISCLLTDADLQALRLGYGNTALLAPPVWPGLASVTLGTPVAIANGASSAAACDGVIIAVSGVPADQGSYMFGVHPSYMHLGQLAFVDDRGDYEEGQSLGFAAAILTPRRMARAAGWVLRVKSGVSGTVTPWSHT